MTGGLGAGGWILIGLAGLWLAIAAALTLVASRRTRDAATILESAKAMKSLLALSPARPVVLRPDGSVLVDERLQRELGAEGVGRLDALSGPEWGIERASLDQLIAAARTAALAGEPFAIQVKAAAAERVFEVRGIPAPPPEPPGTQLLWFSDRSGAENERARLSLHLKEAESALDSLTQLIEATPFPIWYRGPDMRLGLVNRAFVEAVEADSARDVIERQIELVDQSEHGSAADSARAALESGKAGSEVQPATLRGERRTLRIVNVPLPTGAVAGFAVDIQDLEDARNELARYMRSQRDLSDRMTAGAIQFDSDRNVSFFNRPFAVIAQIDPEWLSEGPEFDRVLDQMRDQHRLPVARDFPAWKAERRDWFTSAQEVIEEEWILADGDHVRVVAQPLPDGGLRLFLEDRTEQVRLASARDTLLRVRAATFDNLFEAISVFASDGRLYLWNRRFSNVWELEEEWLSGHPRVDELVPAFARKLANPTAAAQIREMVRQTTSDRRPANGRLSLTDGRHFEFAAVPLPDGNALFTLVDVTDSHRIESALRERADAFEQADRIKTGFVANMSYELRTPLTSIGGFAEMLAAGYAGEIGTQAREYVAAILESVERLSRLVDNVLDLTQADTGGLVLERERVDMAGLCRNAAAALKRRADEKKQVLETRIDPSTGFVSGDPRRLRESLEHVLGNAIAYTDRKGRIRLDATGSESHVTITIHDNGIGIAEADLPHVFDRFARIDEDGVRGEAALGLGLPLTRQFVEAHGGTVELKSRKDRGTTVTIQLPRGAS